MMKRFSLVAVLLLVLCVLTLGVSAEGSRVFDEGEFFTGEESAYLEDRIDLLSAAHDIDILIITLTDNPYPTAEKYGQEFYLYGDYGYGSEQSGMVFVIDMDNRELDLSTHGLAKRIFSDTNVDYVLDSAVNEMKKGDDMKFATADAFLNASEDILLGWEDYSMGDPDSSSNYAQAGSRRPEPKFSIPVSLAIGFGSATILVVILVLVHNRSLPGAVPAENYISSSGFALADRTDRFINSHVSRTVRPTSNSSSGGGGGSSGGGSGFGGGSRSF